MARFYFGEATARLNTLRMTSALRSVKVTIRRASDRVRCIGLRYTCPFCQAHLSTFLPFGIKSPVLKTQEVVGGGYRSNVICPRCGSVDRERLVYLFILRKTDLIERHTRLLHVAPEQELSKFLKRLPTVDYVTVDLRSADAMVNMDITSMEFPDEHFDAIICNHVLEHIIDDRKAMAELYRTLTPEGWAVLQVPLSMALRATREDASITTPAGREAAFGQDDHVRIYARDYRDRLEAAGFKVEVFTWTSDPDNFGGPGNRFGLNEKEAVYFARK